MAAERQTAAATRGDAQWIGFVSASTTAVVWVASHFVFRGVVPEEVVGVIQYGVPLGLSALAAELRWRTARRRGECPSSEQ
jgi:hypothetical protein